MLSEAAFTPPQTINRNILKTSVFLKSLPLPCFFVFLQLWATSSVPAVPRGHQGAANCANCAGETAPGPTASRTMTTVEPSSQYQSLSFLFFYSPLITSTHLLSERWPHRSLFTAGNNLTCNADAPVDWSTLQMSGRRRWRGCFCEASHCTWSVLHNHIVSSAGHIGHLK